MICRAWTQGARNLKWDDPELDRRVELDWRSWLELAAEALARPGPARQSPRQRLETGLACIRNARVRLQIRRIFEGEIPQASVFWDEAARRVFLVADEGEITIRERDQQTQTTNQFLTGATTA